MPAKFLFITIISPKISYVVSLTLEKVFVNPFLIFFLKILTKNLKNDKMVKYSRVCSALNKETSEMLVRTRRRKRSEVFANTAAMYYAIENFEKAQIPIPRSRKTYPVLPHAARIGSFL